MDRYERYWITYDASSCEHFVDAFLCRELHNAMNPLFGCVFLISSSQFRWSCTRIVRLFIQNIAIRDGLQLLLFLQRISPFPLAIAWVRDTHFVLSHAHMRQTHITQRWSIERFCFRYCENQKKAQNTSHGHLLQYFSS